MTGKLQILLENIAAQCMDKVVGDIGQSIAAHQITYTAQQADPHQEDRNHQPGTLCHQVSR